MDVKAISQKRNKLEEELLALIMQKVSAFNEETGVCVKHIYVNMAGEITFGTKEATYWITGVKCEIEI